MTETVNTLHAASASASPAPSFTELLAERADDPHPALHFEGRSWTWAQVAAEAAARAAAASDFRASDPGRRVHVAALLNNVPDFVFWILAASIGDFVLVSVNPTRRGAELAHDITHTECDVILTENAHLQLLIDADPPVAQVWNIDSDEYAAWLEPFQGASLPATAPDPADPCLLMFSSGSTGTPKAVICTHGALARRAQILGDRIGIVRETVAYLCMPLFHGNSLFTNLAPGVSVGATIVMRRRFSASGFVDDLHRHRFTFVNYVGRAISYILATDVDPRDRRSSLQLAYGSEVSPADMVQFRERFGCVVWDPYGSSEGALSIVPEPDSPPGALGQPSPGQDIRVLAPDGTECPRARFDTDGRLTNADEAIGEIVGIGRAHAFAGYYKNPEAEAERIRGDDYWSGDLAYRDEGGDFYFAGRTADWIRVDGENFAAAPIERIIGRFAPVSSCFIYAVPDPSTGDNVMCTLTLHAGSAFDAAAFGAFLDEQSDLGTKWRPRFVRIARTVPQTGSNKVDKRPLRLAAWETSDPVWWLPDRDRQYVELTDDDRERLSQEFAEHGRADVAPPRTERHLSR